MPPAHLDPATKRLCEQLHQLLASDRGAQELLVDLRSMAKDWRVRRLLWRLGPALYQRDPAAFRSFLLTHLDMQCIDETGLPASPWKSPHRDGMERWLLLASQGEDVEMFRMLYGWRASTWPRSKRHRRWSTDLKAEFTAAETSAAKSTVLEKLQGRFVLDEPTAAALCRHDSVIAAEFVAQHLPRCLSVATGYWAEMSALARALGDETLFFAIYRATVEDEQWARDVDALVERLDEASLRTELERRQPTRPRTNVSSVLFNALRKRGDAALPFVMRLLQASPGLPDADVGRTQDLIRLAEEREWLDLWGVLLRGAGRQKDFEREVRRLVEDRRRSERDVLRRLRLLAGVGGAPSQAGLGRSGTPPLSGDTAARLYARFPALVRGAFRDHVVAGMAGGDLRLLEAALEGGDAPLVDALASRVVGADLRREAERRQLGPAAELLSNHYAGLRELCALPLRCAAVLGHLRKGAVRALDRLVAVNPLARLFWRQPASSLLACPVALRALLACEEPHVQLIALLAMASDHPRAAKVARANLDLLRGTLLAPMPRRVRLAAFAAIARAVQSERAAAQLIVGLQEALDIALAHYPREQLLSLIANVLRQWPRVPARSVQELP